MKLANLLLAVLIPSLLWGCATERPALELEREASASPKQVAEKQSAISRPREMAPNALEKYDVAVIGGSCAPKKPAKRAVVACVNDRPCNGVGLRLPNGAIECACFERRGGCDADSFCDDRTRRCVKLPDDPYHPQ